MIHCDQCGPTPVSSIDGYMYYVIFVDDFSRFIWFYPLKHKFDFSIVLKTFLAIVQTQYSCRVEVFQSDGGTEFLNKQVKSFC